MNAVDLSEEFYLKVDFENDGKSVKNVSGIALDRHII